MDWMRFLMGIFMILIACSTSYRMGEHVGYRKGFDKGYKKASDIWTGD